MDFTRYLQISETNIDAHQQYSPYNNLPYTEYSQLNFSHTKCRMKTAILSKGLLPQLNSPAGRERWIVMGEPWCSDVSANLPIFVRPAEVVPQVNYEMLLRDIEHFFIKQYLTGGSKSIFKLVIPNQSREDLAVWGPWPAGAQALVEQSEAESPDLNNLKTEPQSWQNTDAGRSLQTEMPGLLGHVEPVALNQNYSK